MKGFILKIISLLLALALVAMPVRVAFADDHRPADVGHGAATQLHGTASHTVLHAHDNHQAMLDMSCDTPCDTPGNNGHTNNDTHHCSSSGHCCVALLESIYDVTHVTPHTPRSTLSVTLTSIIIPTATKPPRHS